jgi:hypothetical protein
VFHLKRIVNKLSKSLHYDVTSLMQTCQD